MRCKDKEDFVLANYKNMSYDEIGKILGITRNSVQYYLTKNGIRKMERELTPEELEFIQHNYKTMTYKEIAKKLQVSETHVKGHINYKKWSKNRKFNDRYFRDIDSDIKAYFLGFIFADGWVCHNPKNKNYEFGMELQSGDKYILDKLNEELGGVHTIIHSNPSTIKIKDHKARHNNSDILRIYSKPLVNDLMMNGIAKRKSLKGDYPVVSDEYFFDFLRGYIDGDGCYTYIGRKKHLIAMQITCANEAPLKWIKLKLKEHGINTHIYSENQKKFRLYCGKQEDILRLLTLLYHDNFSLCLSRKYEKVKPFLAPLYRNI
jgi:DNA-binding CsgD family transcriptional regulator